MEHSRITLAGSELRIVAPKTYKLYLDDKQFAEEVREVFGRPLRVQVSIGETGPQAAPPSPAAPSNEDDATRRALANSEVQRFREVFGGEIRKVRNLKE